MSSPGDSAWLRLDLAPNNRSTCKFASCSHSAGKIAEGELTVVPTNTVCGSDLGRYHARCFFLSQAIGSGKSADGASPRWAHSSPYTNKNFPAVIKSSDDRPTRELKKKGQTPPARVWITKVEDIDGFAELSAEQQKQAQEFSRLEGTGAGSKMKAGKRKFDAGEKKKSAAAASSTTSRKKKAKAAEQSED